MFHPPRGKILPSTAELRVGVRALVFLLGIFASASAAAAEVPRNARLQAGPSRGIEWKTKSPSIRLWKKNGKTWVVVKLEGTLKNGNRNLALKTRPVRVNPQTGQFQFEVVLVGKETPVRLSLTDPRGTAIEEKLSVHYDGWKTSARKKSGNSYFVGLGMSSIQFTQSRTVPLSEKAITFKGGVTIPGGSPDLNFGATFYITALPLPESAGAQTSRFLGVSPSIRYALPWLTAPWRWSLAGGLYYVTMMPEGNYPGYRNVMGPALTSSFEWTLARRHRLGLSLRYAALLGGNSLTSSREVAGSGTWTYLVGNGFPLLATLDIADLAIVSGRTTITSRSVTAGMGFAF